MIIAILILFLLSSPVYANPAGTCDSLDAYYKNIKFNIDQFDDVEEALNFLNVHNGQLITDKGEETFSVIWNEGFLAPATQYQCSHLVEN